LLVEPGLVENVAERLSGMQRIADVFEVAGEHDLVALAAVGDLRNLRALISEICRIKGVRAMDASVVLRELKRNGKEVMPR